MSTRTREVAGIRPRALLGQPPTPLLLAVMDRRSGPADRPLAEAGVVGNHGRPVHVVRRVAAVVAAGAVADEADGAAQTK